MVGTVYLAPEPGAEPFVTAGQAVQAKTQVCIVEVMKLMNSVVAGCDGREQDTTASGGAPDEPGRMEKSESASANGAAGPDAGGSQGAGSGRGKTRGGPAKKQGGLTPG